MIDDLLMAFFICVIIAAAAFIISVLLKDKQTQIKDLAYPPNGDSDGVSLVTFNGFGSGLWGKFRKAYYNGKETHRAYLALHVFFFPVLPVKAYRVSKGKKGYYVYGSEKNNGREMFIVFLQGLAGLAVVAAVLITIVMILS